MYPQVDTKDPAAVEKEVQAAYLMMFPQGDPVFVPTALGWVKDCFGGNYKDYLASDARYHDLEHTLQGTLCMARLLHGRHQADAKPVVSQRMFELGLLAILLHDTGYLKKKDDPGGTGAKYTLTHVTRSVQFAEQLLEEKGCPLKEIRMVQNMIRCTGVNVNLSLIPFHSEVEKIVGFALGTADLLGQMAAGDYVEKLPVLYSEFDESARFYHGKMALTQNFSGADDLVRKTPDFWTKYVRPKISNEFWGLHRFLNQPYPNGPNPYLQRVEANIEKVRKQLAAVA
ncbi:MAG: hypothetical protein DME19_06020 [Verrucomicrobia bacterium]|nr:MAG: hypothetical protein DME19_06020 [Verrucomicrobiota bacterium]